MAVDIAGMLCTADVDVRSVEHVVPDMASVMRLVPHNAGWTERFSRLRSRLRRELGAVASRVEHIGATAVPGLTSRPLIDIQVSVPDIEAEEDYRDALSRLDFELVEREADRRVLVSRTEPCDVQLYVCRAGAAWEADHVATVAYLSAHPERRAAYTSLRDDLLARHRDDPAAYTAAKVPFMLETTRLARAWLGVGARPEVSVAGS